MRKYQEHWNNLKKSRMIRLQADRAKHQSIGIMIRREATRDKMYADKIQSENKRFFINHASVGNLLILTLRIHTL